MRKKQKMRWLWALLAVCLVLGGLPAGRAEAAGEEIAALTTQDNGSPYYIMVNRRCNAVTIYGLDEAGYYTVPVKAMVCSTGREGHLTPLGTWEAGPRYRWCYMVDKTYGQYAIRFHNGYMLHSVCYEKMDASTLLTDEYNDLGGPASRGCVRLQVGDIKWIYDNCPDGTLVTIYESDDPGPLGKPDTLVSRIDPDDPKAGWDPTDPKKDNPWPAWLKEYALPFADVPYGAWYYEDVRYVYEKGLILGDGAGNFAPEEPLSRAMAVQLLSKVSKAELGPAPRAGLWYLPALMWALSNGVADGVSEANFVPDRPVTRQELLVLCYRYEILRQGRAPEGKADLSQFEDGGQVDLFSTAAVSWGVSVGLLAGNGAGQLKPNDTVTRSQAAGIFRRYCGLIEKNL